MIEFTVDTGKHSLHTYRDQIVQLLKQHQVYEENDENLITKAAFLTTSKTRKLMNVSTPNGGLKGEVALVKAKDNMLNRRRTWLSVSVEGLLEPMEEIIGHAFPPMHSLWRLLTFTSMLTGTTSTSRNMYMPIYGGYPTFVRFVAGRAEERELEFYAHQCSALCQMMSAQVIETCPLSTEDSILLASGISDPVDMKIGKSFETDRMGRTERAHIEDILEKYSSIAGLCSLAIGAPRWSPPASALDQLSAMIKLPEISNYGSNLGLVELREAVGRRMENFGIDMMSLEVMITCGGNQAFINAVLALCNEGDKALIMAPYYCSHIAALQLVGAEIIVCPFEAATLQPTKESLEEKIAEHNPKVVVLTTPNNPSGVVWSETQIVHLVSSCKRVGAWLLVDETYHEFTYDGVKSTLPCGKKLGYERIIHVSTFSKAFGMMGWRVGYLVYPLTESDNMRKINDTIPTHTSILSQKLALLSLQMSDEEEKMHGSGFTKANVESLGQVREAVWEIVETLGTVKTFGAFYFLVPIPQRSQLSEYQVVDILATQYKVLVMPGGPFGAPGYFRLSYGSISSTDVLERLKAGIDFLASKYQGAV